MGRVLVVEDDDRVARLLVRALEGDGYAVELAASGPGGLYSALGSDFDLVMLDLMLPGLSGMEVLTRLVDARPEQRVLVVSAVSDVATRVACLEAGAADVVAKPFALVELLARVHARIRVPAPVRVPLLVAGPIALDVRLRRALVRGRLVELSEREYLLLRYLMERAGRPCGRSELLADVWGLSFDPGSNVVDVCVRRLRSKLDSPERVETIRHVGYRIRTD
jgi:two-component system, OmpR family, response regulator